MTSERDIEQVLDRWLAERPTQVADRVLDEVADRIGREPQQPAWRVSRRDMPVISYLKPLAAVAAVVLVAVVGFALLRPSSGSNVGGAATPSATPSPIASASPSASPSAGAAFPAWYTGDGDGAGILPAGSHATRSFMPGFTFTVPQGWVNEFDGDMYGLFPDSPANQAEFPVSRGIAHGLIMAPLESPYLVCDAWEDHRGTAAEMVASMVANEALATSDPIDVTIGGLTGKQIDVQLDPAWTESCPGDPPTADLSLGRTRAILLDTADRGVLVIFVGSLQPDGHEAFVAEAMPIVESFQFDQTP